MSVKRLRFKDENGNNYIDVYEDQIGNVSKIYQPKTISLSELTTDGFPVHGANGIIGNYHSYNHSSDQVLISCRGENCGTVNFSIGKCWITGNTMVINTDENNKLNKKFLYYQLINQNLKYLVTGSGQPQIVRNVLEKHKIKIFNFQEQEKIGNFLSLFDRLIEKIETKIGLLKELKKGYLQQMFPAKGEKVPKIRFAGFDGDWSFISIGDLSKLVTKGTTPLDKSGAGEINFIKVENIDPISGKFHNLSKISLKEHETYLKRSQLRENDILFSIAGTLGRISFVTGEILPANTNQALAIIRLNQGNLNFVLAALKGKAAIDFIKNNPTVGAQPNLSLEQVKSITIDYPKSNEQKKIGNLFKSLDSMIEKQDKELNAIEQLKKGYMQRLFA